jgi:branched-chain amino acid transport system permease protein
LKIDFAQLFRSKKVLIVVIALAIAAVPPLFVKSDYVVGQVFTLMVIFAIYASSWNLLASSGQGSLGHAAFLGIGGFASALAAAKLGLSPLLGVVVGGVVSAGVGFLIGLACVRLKAWFLAMVTFGFSVIIVTIITQFDDFFGGVIGFQPQPITSPGILFYYISLTIATVSILTMFLVMKSKLGLAFKAIHENELESRMAGINTAKYKLIAFVISTFFAGVAGALYVENILLVQVSVFDAYNSFLPLMMAVIGGLGTIEGPIIGSVIIVAINSWLPNIDKYIQPVVGPLFPAVSSAGPYLRLVALGLFLIIVVIFLPKGITSLLRKGYDYLREDTSKTKKAAKPDGKT